MIAPRRAAVLAGAVAVLVSSPDLVLAEEEAAAERSAGPEPTGAAAPGEAAPAEDGPRLPIDVTATTSTGWRTDRGYGEVFGRLNVSTRRDEWSAALRVDTATFISPPDPSVRDRYTLEKASIGWTGRSLDLSLGDAYVSLGRGLGLSLRKVDELGIDTTLRGAKALLHHGDVSATVAVGYANINNVDETTGTSIDDPYDLIAGAQAQVMLGERVTVGTYGAAVTYRRPLGLVPTDDYTDRSLQYGLTIDAPRLTKRVGVYLEGMGQVVSAEPAAEHPRGFGLYGTATAHLGKATLLFEGKAYHELTPVRPNLQQAAFSAVAYNNPPTLERVLQIIENPQTNIAGGRLRADWTFSRRLLVYANYALFRDWVGFADPRTGEIRAGTIHDPYVGAEVRWDEARSWAIGAAGWRMVVLDDSGDGVRRDGHLTLDVSHALNACVSLTLQVFHQERAKRESVILDEQFREGTITAGFRVHPSFTAAAGYDYTTEHIQPKTHYFNGSFGWDLTTSSNLRLLVGSQRGGLRCVSGVCRIVPPFEGVRLTATLRF